jgi:acetyltransferase-like isoleucine patch superfamily enzyme
MIGNFFDSIRMFLLKISGSKIGGGSVVHSNVMIFNPNNLEIGKNSSIGSNSDIFNYSKISIGDNVDIGTHLYINTDNHSFKNPKLPLSKQGGISKEINIGSDVWIGARVIILSGVTVENRVVIGAGSVVTNDLKSGFIYAGVPAKQIKQI